MILLNHILAIVMVLASMFIICVAIQRMWGVQHGFARIVLGALIQDIRNAVGNVVFSAWKGVNYVRNKAVAVSNPNSPDQNQMRAKLTAGSKRWLGTLTQAQRDQWNEYAQGLGSAQGSAESQGASPNELIPTNRGQMSGFNAYVMLNSLAFSAGVTTLAGFLDDAPNGITAPGSVTDLAGSWNETTCCIDLTWLDPAEFQAGARCRVWIQSYNAGVHTQMIQSEQNGEQASSICSVNIALGASSFIRLHPGLYLIQVDMIGGNFQKGPGSNVISVVVPAGCTPA